MMIQVAAKCKVGAIAFLLLCGWWPARLVQHLPVSLPSISFCQVSTLLCTMPLCNYRKSWEDWLLICAELSGLVTPSLLRTCKQVLQAPHNSNLWDAWPGSTILVQDYWRSKGDLRLKVLLFFFWRVSSMCAHFDCALTQAWSTPLLEGLRSEVSTWNAQPAFEYRRGPQHFCLLGWIVWGRSHYTDVDMILTWFEHIWYWYVWNRTQFWPFESALSRPCNTHGFKSWRTLRLPDQCCHLLQLIRKDLKRVRIWQKVFEKIKQASFLLGIHHNSSQSNAAADKTPLWPEMILQLETRGDKAYVTGYTEFMRIRWPILAFLAPFQGNELAPLLQDKCSFERTWDVTSFYEYSKYLRRLACS